MSPWKTDTVPDAVKALPDHAREIWVKVANSALKQYDDEKKAIATAWDAVKNAGYKKGDDGKWHKAEKHSEHSATLTDEEKGVVARFVRILKEKFTDGEKAPDKYAEMRQSGKRWGLALRRVVLQGADVPALKTLKDVVALGENGDLRDVEIFETGTHTSSQGITRHYTEEDLDRIARNFRELREVVKPPLALGHGEDQALLEAEGLPAAGWVDDVRRLGTKLVASFKEVPEVVRKAIELRRYRRISSELYPDFAFGEDDQESILLDSKAEGGDEDVNTFTETEVKQIVDEAVDKATLRFREEIAGLKGEKDEALKRADKIVTEQRKQRVETFMEERAREGFPPALLGDIGFAKFAESLDNNKAEKFSEADGAKEETQLSWFLRFTEEIEKRAKSGKSFLVPKGEIGPGREDHEEFSEDRAHEKGDVALAKKMHATVQPPKTKTE